MPPWNSSAQIAAHDGRSGAYVLDTYPDALQARAWLADHARHTIEVQYFIWSADNIGILAAEALLRAADRGVKVRVIVDDLLIDAPDKSCLPSRTIPMSKSASTTRRIRSGVPLLKRILNVAVDFRGVNQRMHDKTFMVDGQVAIKHWAEHGRRILRLQPRIQFPRPRCASAGQSGHGHAGQL
ncbi:MAG: hypothetical protein IPM27_11525 [Nitrosomonadales bacterium]|nr:hypothetical protein [Nitrosomonadales bacterium]